MDRDHHSGTPTEVALMSVEDLELRPSDRPAIVAVDGRIEIVADHRIIDEGWLRVRDRDGGVRKFPPSSITEVEHLDPRIVENQNGDRTKRVVEGCTAELEFLAGVTTGA
jgi:hypothetical protein